MTVRISDLLVSKTPIQFTNVRISKILIAFLLFLVLSCQFQNENQDKVKELQGGFEVQRFSSVENDTLKSANPDSLETHLKEEEKEDTILKPVFGYRFMIVGDFNGDGKKEQLVERFFDKEAKQETNKFFEGITYDSLLSLNAKKKLQCFVVSDDEKLDTLKIASPFHLGLSYLKNEGDLNGDGTDELSYVVNHADWSNLNTWHLATYRNNRWVELYAFGIWDWELPELPHDQNDSTNHRLEGELKSFQGLVTPIKKGVIQIAFRNDEAELDTMIVDLGK